jgi:putative ABC transport system ATP-binding protein
MEPYLRAIFGFVGIYDIEFVIAQPVDMHQFRDAAMQQAISAASEAARRLVHGAPAVVSEPVPEGLTPQVVLPEAGEPQQVRVAAGRVVFDQGADADLIYMIDEGTVEVYRTEGGDEQVLTILHEGQYFGELGVLLGSPRAAGVRAITDAVLTAYGAQEFRRIVLHH